MGCYRVATANFQVYGDGVTQEYVVDLAKEFPGISGYQILAAYYLTPAPGSQNPEVATNLNYTLVNGVLTVALQSVPLKWFASYDAPSPSPVQFYVTIAY